jgi:hypothetical protein
MYLYIANDIKNALNTGYKDVDYIPDDLNHSKSDFDFLKRFKISLVKETEDDRYIMIGITSDNSLTETHNGQERLVGFHCVIGVHKIGNKTYEQVSKLFEDAKNAIVRTVHYSSITKHYKYVVGEFVPEYHPTDFVLFRASLELLFSVQEDFETPVTPIEDVTVEAPTIEHVEDVNIIENEEL